MWNRWVLSSKKALEVGEKRWFWEQHDRSLELPPNAAHQRLWSESWWLKKGEIPNTESRFHWKLSRSIGTQELCIDFRPPPFTMLECGTDKSSQRKRKQCKRNRYFLSFTQIPPREAFIKFLLDNSDNNRKTIAYLLRDYYVPGYGWSLFVYYFLWSWQYPH